MDDLEGEVADKELHECALGNDIGIGLFVAIIAFCVIMSIFFD